MAWRALLVSVVAVGVLLACTRVSSTALPSTAKTGTSSDQISYKYCALRVQVRDVERCVVELTPEQQRRRAWTTRLTYRGPKVVRREFVSGSGALQYKDVEDYEYVGERISAVLHSSRNGLALGRETFSADRSIVKFFDELGRPKPYPSLRVPSIERRFDATGLVQSIHYLDIAGNPLASGEAYEEREVREANGAVTETAYFGRNGEPVQGLEGAHRTVYERDERGEVRVVRYFDQQGKPKLCDGAHSVQSQRDEVGNITQESFFGTDGRPARSTRWRAATVRFLRDARGNVVSTRLFDEQGRPTLGGNGYASMAIRYDAQDRELEYSHFAVDGSPIELADSGASVLRKTYDTRGNLATERYFDRHGAPVLNNEGFFQVSYQFDTGDRAIAFRYHDVAGQPVAIANGFATKKASYDGDRLVGYSLFDVSDRPTLGREKYARAQLSYDANGRRDTWTYFDLDGTILEHTPDECHGTVPPEMRVEIMSRSAGGRVCYQALLAQDRKAQGKLVLTLRIAQTGEVTEAATESDQIGKPTFAECVLAAFSQRLQHPPEQGCVVVRLPLSFVPTPEP